MFLWVLLCVNPFAKDRPEARFIKSMIATDTMTIGLVDWDTVLATLKGFIKVQKWLGSAPQEKSAEVYSKSVSKPPSGGLPAWSLKDV